MWSVKESANFISEPLTHIVNLSIETGIVPDQMKIARVIPLFKSGDNNLSLIINQSQFCRFFLNC